MSVKIKGEVVNTVAEAAEFFGVSTKTVQGWIRQEIVSAPPVREYGAGDVQVFPLDYLKKAKQELDEYRRKSKRPKNGNGLSQ